MSNINNLFVNVEFSGLMDFDCVTCGETVYVPITAEKDEEYRCDNCSHTYKPREALKQFSRKFPDKVDVIDTSSQKFKEAKEKFENDDDFRDIEFNKVKREIYNSDNVQEFCTTCNFDVSGGATFMKGRRNAAVQYGGKTRISGIDNIEDAEEFAEFVAGKLVDGKVEDVNKPSSYNISKKLEYGLDLGKLSQILHNDMDRMYQVEYEPETFPGIIGYYNHGFDVKFGDETVHELVQESAFNIVNNGEFILSVKISPDNIDDKNDVNHTEMRGAYEIDINSLLESDIVGKSTMENNVTLNMSDGRTVHLSVDVGDDEVSISGAEKTVNISRVSTNILLYSSKKVVLNSPKIRLANDAFENVKEFINKKSKGISEVPKNNGTEKRHVFTDTDHTEIKEELSNLPKDIDKT